MNNLDELVKKYNFYLTFKNTINARLDDIDNKAKDRNCSETDLFSVIVLILEKMSKIKIDYDSKLNDILKLSRSYKKGFDSINLYKESLLKFVSNTEDTAKIEDNYKKINKSRNAISKIENEISEKYGINLNSPHDLYNITRDAFSEQLNVIDDAIVDIKEEADRIVKLNNHVRLTMNDSLNMTDELPCVLDIARVYEDNIEIELFRDLGIKGYYSYISSDLKRNGNVLIKTDYTGTSDKEIDEFVISYIMKCLQVFPLGMVNIYIQDKDPNYLYQRLLNIFSQDNISESALKVIKISESMSEIIDSIKNSSTDILKKTNASIPDLYSLHSVDNSDPFKIVVLRDGFTDNSGYSSTDNLSSIEHLTNVSQTGHITGTRFLIIDGSDSLGKKQDEKVEYLINEIRNNCELIFEYANHSFLYQDEKVEILHVDENIDTYIQNRASAIAEAITKKDKNTISFIDVNKEKVFDAESVLTIPVGVSGNEMVEIPISCRDENGTAAGQCIGYMVIGRSGSGKSSFFHNVVIEGCKKYSPKDLQFWLLDFKSGAASSKYKNSNIPHIRIIAENNKIDDAVCLFQMIGEEIDRRNNLFNKKQVNDIIDYNSLVKNDNKAEYLPRILIVIDEVQEIFRDEKATFLKDKISSISSRMRSAGMHFIMISQNVSDGKANMLKEAFMSHVKGRVCFQVSENVVRDSGFGEDFYTRNKEIAGLSTGEAYIGYGQGTIKKVRTSFIKNDEMNNILFPLIREKYRAYFDMKPMIIGKRQRLAPVSLVQDSDRIYFDELLHKDSGKNTYNAIIGEDSYRLEPLKIRFSQSNNSSVLLLGSDQEMASSLCTSFALSFLNQNINVKMINGDKTKTIIDDEEYDHPFMYICKNASKMSAKYINYKVNEFNQAITELNSIYKKRQDISQNSEEDEIPKFEPEIWIINDLFDINSFKNDESIGQDSDEHRPSMMNRSSSRFSDKETIQTIIGNVLKDGYIYNIHLVISIKGNPSIWRTLNIEDVNNIVLFNVTQFADRIDSHFIVKQMLENIANDDDETLAIWLNKKQITKFRPVIYYLNEEAEHDLLNKVCKEND